ncbi:Hypothetical protein SRAE_1000032700 [Strongyloides ratti]|uniref:Uncharacterized protein n=1 Tax=Strongyloides ratti TaxID=34506 RepID=A0A090L1Q4_STRRB|nr:Hypothetical protein SRAE_1000032700 [Strongyloides ratti]CEF62052.1 Hypothetical protein SRAE_1000032700 [Strongyloides ratti]
MIVILPLISLIKCQSNDGSVLKKKACDRMANLVSTFITCQQLISILDQASGLIADGTDLNTTVSEMTSIILGSLTASQNVTAITKGAPLVFSLGISGIQKAISTLITVMTDNLMPLGEQLDSLAKMWIDDSMPRNVIVNQLYYYGLSFVTKKRIGTLFKRYKNAVGDKSFASIKSALNSLIKFNLYT